MKREKKSPFDTFTQGEDGATAIEYALLASLLALMAISGVRAVSVAVSSLYQTVLNAFTGS